MAWRRPGDKPLSEPRMESLLTHICVTRPQWVNSRLNYGKDAELYLTFWYGCNSLSTLYQQSRVPMWLTHCGLVTPCGEIWVNIGSSNVLLPVGTKPSEYLNQWWLIIQYALWSSLESHFITIAQGFSPRDLFWYYYHTSQGKLSYLLIYSGGPKGQRYGVYFVSSTLIDILLLSLSCYI